MVGKALKRVQSAFGEAHAAARDQQKKRWARLEFEGRRGEEYDRLKGVNEASRRTWINTKEIDELRVLSENTKKKSKTHKRTTEVKMKPKKPAKKITLNGRTYYLAEQRGGAPVNRTADKRRNALPPGRRQSASGRWYTERRVNRSDTVAERAAWARDAAYRRKIAAAKTPGRKKRSR